jgi:diguanylate cyclase (GGDEF)-like protein/PAS domain S-box-containing protein
MAEYARAIAPLEYLKPAPSAHREGDEAQARVRHAALEASANAIVLTDPQGRIEWTNRAFTTLTGYELDEVRGQTPRVLKSGAHGQALYADLWATIRAGEVWHGEVINRRKDGTTYFEEMTITPVRDEQGEIARFVAIKQDVTERKRAAEALRQSQQELQLLLEHTPDVISRLDRQCRHLYVNRAIEPCGGLEVAAYLGKTHRELGSSPELAEPIEAGVRAVFSTGREITMEVPNREHWHLVQLVPERDAAGQVTSVLSVCRDITERKKAELALEHQALHDELTGLPNRTLLRDRLDQAVREHERTQQPLALLVLDMDRFKEVNDTLGHPAGDVLLRQVGQRLCAGVRASDSVARLGGDEFAVILPGVGAEDAMSMARAVLAQLHAPLDIEGHVVSLSSSIGITVCPDHGVDPDVLLRRADVAMYAAKASGCGSSVYAAKLDKHSPQRLAMDGELRRAIASDGLVLHYQPKVDLRSGLVAGVEALVRWQHPQRGFVEPAEFIPLAEHSGLIRPLTEWVIAAALAQHKIWRNEGLELPVAVNLSVRVLPDGELPGFIARLLDEMELPSDALEIEVTESGLMVDPERSRQNIAALRALGLKVAIDDFGTGYSSLAYLRELQVDEVKIDKSFVRDLAADANDRAIVRAVLDIASDLGLRVVAEGVEDAATWDLLVGLGCDLAQGYYLSPPLGPRELDDWLRRAPRQQTGEGVRGRLEETLRERERKHEARLVAEEEFLARKRAEAALRESEERRSLALQAAGLGTWEVDYARDVHVWSSETEALFGVAPGSFEGTTAAVRRLIHPDDWPGFEQQIRDSVVQHGEAKTTFRVIWPDGSVHWIEGRARCLFNSNGRLDHITGTVMDVTDRKQAEQERERLARSEKLRALGQMASGIAHDLNQSLMLVASYGDLARRALDRPTVDRDELVELLTIATQAALDGGETVKRLLRFTRAPLEEQKQRLNLGEIVREAVNLTAPRWRDVPQAEGRPIRLELEVAAGPTIVGSPSNLREVVTNLVFNAVDALPSGGSIVLRVSEANEQAIVEVIDSGVGMPPEVQAHIFEPFFSTKGESGTGLGLAQVFGILEQHKGQIQVDSAPGAGTTVRLSFPLAPAESVSLEPALEHVRPATPARSLRILAVDDEPAMTKAVARMLRPTGHLVRTAGSGEEALERLAQEPFDVVVSDLGMGSGMNGWDLAAAVRSQWPAVRFLLATGWGAAIDPGEASGRGVEAVLAKPYRLQDLQQALSR